MKTLLLLALLASPAPAHGQQPDLAARLAQRGAPAGFAFYFFHYSTWRGQPTLFLEDLFVRPQYRGKGIGKALLVHLAKIAVAENCGRFEWQVLDWNTPSIEFYKSLGAEVMKEWLTMRISGEGIAKLAAQAV